MAGRCLNPDDVRPNPALGTYYYVPHNHSGERTGPDMRLLVAYRFPPSMHFLPQAPPEYRRPYPTFMPDSYIGPVVGVDQTRLSTSALINNRWVTVWSCHPHPQPAGPPLLIGTHHLRPARVGANPSWSSRLSAHIRPVHDPWDHPYQDLWVFNGELGLGHIVAPGRHIPPRFLLTGAAWARLYHVREHIRGTAQASLWTPGHPFRRGDLWWRDRHALCRCLHHFLDYPLVADNPSYSYHVILAQQTELLPRRRLHAFLCGIVRRRRIARANEKRRLLLADRALPPPVLGLENAVQIIAEYL